MTESDEKLWKEIENCLEYDYDIYGGDDVYGSVFLHTTSIENLMDWFKNKETDLLKEFVEWYKEHLNYLVKYEKDLYADAKTNQHEDNATFFAGEINMLERLLGWIDRRPEQFLKEKL